jgi:hypothetical protein
VKVALIGLLVFAAFATGWWVRGEQEARKSAAPPTVMTPAERAAAQARAEQCRDDCEQRHIVQRLGDDWLASCRASCAPPARPYEPIRSITRAPTPAPR